MKFSMNKGIKNNSCPVWKTKQLLNHKYTKVF
nr:MAG TPA: hypothetical protein [Caudoviricetes sp.]DAN90386.1 MAG TPA: hypothetical protein [Bacteriophage sp.]